MTIDQWLLASSDVISLLGFAVVVIQLWDTNRQKRLESQIRLNDINRELISLGISKPELLEILNDARKADPLVGRRYLQLWLNQLSLVYSFRQNGAFEADYQECCERDVRDTMHMPNMRRHWEEYKKYYPASFQEWVDSILTEAG